MTRTLLTLATLALSSVALAAPTPSTPQATVATNIHGDYVEARTASVFAGACHFNGEVVTIGHDAVAAWDITSGSFNGTDLTGVKAMAAVDANANLGDAHTIRRCELLIDTAATRAQVSAFTDWIKTHGDTFGAVTAVRRGQVGFRHEGSVYTVTSDHFATLNVQSMPNNECCKQPSLVWYTPLLKLDHRKVGYTLTAAYDAATLSDPWQRSEENSAFYGTFTE